MAACTAHVRFRGLRELRTRHGYLARQNQGLFAHTLPQAGAQEAAGKRCASLATLGTMSPRGSKQKPTVFKVQPRPALPANGPGCRIIAMRFPPRGSMLGSIIGFRPSLGRTWAIRSAHWSQASAACRERDCTATLRSRWATLVKSGH